MIHQMERRLQGFDVDLYSQHLKNIDSKGNYGFGLLIIYEWKELPSLLGFLFFCLGGGTTIAIQYIGYQLIPTQLGDNVYTIFILILLMVLSYTVVRSGILRKQYVKKIRPREVEELVKEYERKENIETKKKDSGGT